MVIFIAGGDYEAARDMAQCANVIPPDDDMNLEVIRMTLIEHYGDNIAHAPACCVDHVVHHRLHSPITTEPPNARTSKPYRDPLPRSLATCVCGCFTSVFGLTDT